MTTLEKPLLQLTAADLMTRDVTVIPQHLSLKAAAHLLAQANVSGAPVIDEHGCCVGVLSTTDLVQWVDRGARAAKRVGKASACVCSDWQMIAMDLMPEDEVGRYMTTDVVSTRPEALIGEMARWMAEAHIHRVVIVDGEGRPIGLVSSMDILAAVADSAPRERDEQ
jgi:CBS-domain-containing membrane protein